MSLAEIKRELGRLSAHELDELAACVQYARKHSDPDWLERVAAINDRMDAGGGTSEDELRKLHERLGEN